MTRSSETPSRPRSLPKTAEWDVGDQEWRVGKRSPLTSKEMGTWKGYRKDGSLKWTASYHPGWHGALHGEVRYFATDGRLERLELWDAGYIAEARTFAADGQMGRVEHFEKPQQVSAVAARPDTDGEPEEGSAAEPSPAVEKLGRRYLKRSRNETAAKAISRLAGFCAAAKKARWRDVPKLKRGNGFSAGVLAAAEKKLGIKLHRTLAAHLRAYGAMAVTSGSVTLRYAATARALDFDEQVGQVLDAGYAKLYGLRSKGFDQEKVDGRFVRVALAALHFEDDDVHEDGDTAVIILDRQKPALAPEIWSVPHDDGYGIGDRIGSLDRFVSWAVDRTIRCTMAGQ